MAFADLNPLGALWQGRGLHCLLLPHDAPAACSLCRDPTPGAQPAPKSRPAPHDARSVQPLPSKMRPGVAPAFGPQATGTANSRPAKSGAPKQEAQQKAQGKQSAQGQQSAAPPAGQSQASWRPLPPHVWPAPWQERLAATRPGLVLWTYWKLGQDLGGLQDEGHAARRAFFRRLLADLGHPGGTHTFWPACLPPVPAARCAPSQGIDALPLSPTDAGRVTGPPQEEAVQVQIPTAAANPHVFWSGVSRLGARGVVVMGSAAVKALALPGNLRPLQQTRHCGHLVWVLWDVDYLLHEDQRYAAMLAFLRRALRQVARN